MSLNLRKGFRILLWTGLVVLFLGGLGFVWWAETSYQGTEAAQQALEPPFPGDIRKEPWIAFEPQDSESRPGLILYPGGRVEPEAYAPLARAISEEGYRVIIPPMPLNLAVFAPGRAENIMDAYPDVAVWAVGGHSLGGAMAASFAGNHPERVQGLVLWASYPAESNDLSGYELEVVSIYASQDQLATPEKVLASKPLLPENTKWVLIEGGNHAGFGQYGPQEGDGQAAIDREKQHRLIVQATVELLEEIGGDDE